jgi:hypothetical protein
MSLQHALNQFKINVLLYNKVFLVDLQRLLSGKRSIKPSTKRNFTTHLAANLKNETRTELQN